MKLSHFMLAGIAVTIATSPVAMANPVMPAQTITRSSSLKFVPLDPKDITGKGVMVKVLVGKLSAKGPVAFLAKIPQGKGEEGHHAHGSDLFLTHISGGRFYTWGSTESKSQALKPGETIFIPAGMKHYSVCEAGGEPCLNFAYYPMGFDVR